MQTPSETTFALLGTDPLAYELTRNLSTERGERLIAATTDPAEILALPGLEVLILADFAPNSLAVAERIASRTSLLVLPDARLGSSFVYSLVLPDQDGTSVLLPAFPLRYDGRIQQLRERIELGTLGRVVAARFERLGGGASASGTEPTMAGQTGRTGAGDSIERSGQDRRTFFSLAEAQRAILHDADLLRVLLGEFRKVSAVRAGTGDDLANLTVTFGGAEGLASRAAGPNGLDVFWTYRRGDRDQADLVLQMERCDVRLSWNAAHLVSVSIGGEILPSSSVPVAAHILDDLRVRRAVRRPAAIPGERAAETEGMSTWTDLLRGFDLVDAVGRSIRRRRTIELHFEEASERNQFKTQMTTAGCAVAMFTLVGLVLLLVVGALADPRDSQQRLAEGARLVIHQARESDGKGLTADQKEELKLVQKNYRVSPTAILIEGPSSEDPEARQLREIVVRELQRTGFADADTRVVIQPFRGQWFARVMIAAWIALFLPLAVFLSLQGLLLVARPGGNSEE